MAGDPDIAALVAKAAGGDSASWDALVDRFAGLVYSVVRSHNLYGDTAADVCQTVWLRAVEHLDQVREPERVGSWLATTARHECLRILRRSGRQLPVSDVPEHPDDEPERDVDAALLAGERRDIALAALALAPPRCQELLRLLLVEPALSYEEISNLLGIPKGSIGPTRLRCIEYVRSRLRRAGIHGPGADS